MAVLVSVLGVSGSPIENGNTDRLVRYVLEATGLDFKFVKFSKLNIHPCDACATCAKFNICHIDDDMKDIYPEIVKARALVVGGWSPYGMLDSNTKMFIERLFCLRHRFLLNKGKFGAAIVVGTINPNDIADQILKFFELDGIIPIGKVVASGIDPCWRQCGFGETCLYGTPLQIQKYNYQPLSYPKKLLKSFKDVDNIKITDKMIPPTIEGQRRIMRRAKLLGKKIAKKIVKRATELETFRKTILKSEESDTSRLRQIDIDKPSIDTLLVMTEYAFKHGWIKNKKSLDKLKADLSKAKDHLIHNQQEKARINLNDYLEELIYQGGEFVESYSYTDKDYSPKTSEVLAEDTRTLISSLYANKRK